MFDIFSHTHSFDNHTCSPVLSCSSGRFLTFMCRWWRFQPPLLFCALTLSYHSFTQHSNIKGELHWGGNVALLKNTSSFQRAVQWRNQADPVVRGESGWSAAASWRLLWHNVVTQTETIYTLAGSSRTWTHSQSLDWGEFKRMKRRQTEVWSSKTTTGCF